MKQRGQDFNFSLDQVCDMMEEMNWLFSHTDYEKLFSSLRERNRNWMYLDEDLNRASIEVKRLALLPWRNRQAEMPEHIQKRMQRYM